MKRFLGLGLSCFQQAIVILFLLSVAGYGQHGPIEQAVEYSKSDVERALQQVQEYREGKLPIVDGFVVAGAEPLDRFQRAYYTITFNVTSPSPRRTVVKVSAKITAWYSGDSAALSGYRALPSNGRLELDMFERLQQLLPASQNRTEVSNSPENTQPSGLSIPDAPDARLSAKAATNATKPTGKLSAGIAAPLNSTPKAIVPDGNAARIRQLKEERSALEEISRNQSHPDNLASVLTSHTAVVAQPAAGAHVLFYAEAQDEFPVLGTKDNWVHVTISGISRGWIRRSQLDLSAAPGAAGAASNSSADPFRSTREETSSFPGTWAPLQGKSVKVIWVEPTTPTEAKGTLRLKYAMSLMRKASQAKDGTEPSVDGVVIVFDSAEGGMVAATRASLQRWQDGGLSDATFEKQCWFSPVEAFVNSQQ